jgi:ribonuclease I
MEYGKSSVCLFNATKLWLLCSCPLRPTKNGTLGPNYCNKVTFYLDKVEDLVPQLISQWTNVKTDTSFTSFWAHEYEKHGSCALELNAMSSEHDFFSQTLKLHQELDFTTVLENAGLVPSTTTEYHKDDFERAFQTSLGVQPLLECLYSQAMGQVLYQISICLRKDFSIMPCEQYVFNSSKTSCYDDETFLYIPHSTH